MARFSGVLKYFIDMLKFPESFDRKPVAFRPKLRRHVGRAAGSVEQLQMIFGYRNAHIFPERVFIPGIGGHLNAQGKLNDSELDDRVKKQCINFAKFANVIHAAREIG